VGQPFRVQATSVAIIFDEQHSRLDLVDHQSQYTYPPPGRPPNCT
jgi:hypothetical protein